VRGTTSERRQTPSFAATRREIAVALCPQIGVTGPGLRDAEGAVQSDFADQGEGVLEEVLAREGEEGGEGCGIGEGGVGLEV